MLPGGQLRGARTRPPSAWKGPSGGRGSLRPGSLHSGSKVRFSLRTRKVGGREMAGLSLGVRAGVRDVVGRVGGKCTLKHLHSGCPTFQQGSESRAPPGRQGCLSAFPPLLRSSEDSVGWEKPRECPKLSLGARRAAEGKCGDRGVSAYGP